MNAEQARRWVIERMQFVEPTVSKGDPMAKVDQACAECGEKKATVERYAGLCFSCHYWLQRVNSAGEPTSVRADGVQYWLGKEGVEQPASWRGSGGARYIIRFFDGREVETLSLWYNGPIPERFRERLPDNAQPPAPEPAVAL